MLHRRDCTPVSIIVGIFLILAAIGLVYGILADS